MTNPDKRDLLTGWTAEDWRRARIWAYFGATALSFLALLGLFVGPVLLHLAVLPFVAVFALGFLALLVMAILLRLPLPMESAEVASGYTTLRRAHIELDQLDPRTGIVLRKAGAPYLTPRRTVHPSAANEGMPRRASVARRFLPLIIVVGLGIAIVAATLAVFAPRSSPIVTGVFVAIMVVIFVTVFVGRVVIRSIVTGNTRRAFAELREKAPGAFVFMFASSPELFSNLVDVPVGQSRAWADVGLGSTWGATVDAAGVSLWTLGPTALNTAIPWARVTAVSSGFTSVLGRQRAAVSLAVTVDGAPVQVPFASPFGRGFYAQQSGTDIGWIRRTLDWYRARATSF